MKLKINLIFTVAIILNSCSHRTTVEDENTVALVNNAPIAIQTFEREMNEQNKIAGMHFTELKARTDLLNDIVNQELLAQEAIREELHVKNDNVKKALARAMVEKITAEAKPIVTDKMINDYYLQHQRDLDRVHVAHILFGFKNDMTLSEKAKLKKQAEQLRADLIKNPEEFAAMAAKYSSDNSNKDSGGDLGWFKHGAMVPAFETAAFELNEAGDMSDVVETQYGYHLLLLKGKKVGVTENRADIVRAIETPPMAAALQQFLTKQRSTAKIKLHPEKLMRAKEKSNLTDLTVSPITNR